MGEGPGGRTANVGLRRSHPRRNFPRARARLRARFQGSSPDSPGSWCAARDRRRRGNSSGGRSRSPARWGWRERVLVRLTRAPPCPGIQEGEQEGPVGHIPGTGWGGHLESRPGRDAVAQTKLGRRDARSVGPRVRAPPPAWRHYLHEDPEEQGSDPDLDGQLPHGAARAVPGAAAAGALGDSRSSTSAGSPDPGQRGRRAPGRGRGREAGAGRGRAGAGEGSAQTTSRRPRGSRTPLPPLPPLPAPRPRAKLGAPRGLPAPWRRAPPPRPDLRGAPAAPGGEGKPGEAPPPLRPPPPLRAPRLPRQWAAPALGSRGSALAGSPPAAALQLQAQLPTPALRPRAPASGPHVGRWQRRAGGLSGPGSPGTLCSC